MFQIRFACAAVTVRQGSINHTVDFLLALVLMRGSATGAQVGARLSRRLRADQLKIMMACIILGTMVAMSFELVVRPSSLLAYGGGH